MGVCCGEGIKDPEILNATNINELIEILNERKEKFPQEKKQIQDYINDPTKEVDSINVSGIDNEILKQRVPYLNDLENAYNIIIEYLSSNPDLPLKETKEECDNITSLYNLTYDPNKELDMQMQKFENFINKYKKK
jgi:hypothetical protein